MIRRINHSSSFQDHIHVYTKTNVSASRDGGFMIPFHKDSGFILFLTPFPLHPLMIKDKHGETLSTDGLMEDSVIVILGTGITEWLLGGTGDRFHAASHAVAALDDRLSSRAVVARMKVVPETARSLHGELFGDYFRRSLKSEEHISGNNISHSLRLPAIL